jgi:hypothetical protein
MVAGGATIEASNEASQLSQVPRARGNADLDQSKLGTYLSSRTVEVGNFIFWKHKCLL